MQQFVSMSEKELFVTQWEERFFLSFEQKPFKTKQENKKIKRGWLSKYW
jgi:hypothetical protein